MNYLELSKEISYALRHAPWEYELEMDNEGWVNIHHLLDSLHENLKWAGLEENDLKKMIDTSEKKRHEIVNDKIRASYGHSIQKKILKNETLPPKNLYHGTAVKSLPSIIAEGLRPCKRQYVHLSKDIKTAVQVGKRKDDNPVLIIIDTEKALIAGIKFYYGNEFIWLADFIPPSFLDIINYEDID